MVCPKCGAMVNDDVSVCDNCGYEFETATAAAEAAPAAVTAPEEAATLAVAATPEPAATPAA